MLLESDNYVTRRRSLKLLGELLLDRSNFNVMMRFISDKHYLKVVMTMLRDKSASIQFEAFHVFKVFVANPKKPTAIRTILYKNRDKLVTYLSNFQTDKEDAHTLLTLQKPEEETEDTDRDRDRDRDRSLGLSHHSTSTGSIPDTAFSNSSPPTPQEALLRR
eukprot:gene8306-17087_t